MIDSIILIYHLMRKNSQRIASIPTLTNGIDSSPRADNNFP